MPAVVRASLGSEKRWRVANVAVTPHSLRHLPVHACACGRSHCISFPFSELAPLHPCLSTALRDREEPFELLQTELRYVRRACNSARIEGLRGLDGVCAEGERAGNMLAS